MINVRGFIKLKVKKVSDLGYTANQLGMNCEVLHSSSGLSKGHRLFFFFHINLIRWQCRVDRVDHDSDHLMISLNHLPDQIVRKIFFLRMLL